MRTRSRPPASINGRHAGTRARSVVSSCKPRPFTATAKDGQTEVVWSMDGPADFMTKVVSVFVSMDKMLGANFAQGLANLKAVVDE